MGRSFGRRVLATATLAMVASLFLYEPGPARGATTSEGDEAGFLALVNRERAARGLGRLVEAGDLVTVARRHSARMEAQDDVFHNSRLSSEVEGWEILGENVGVGPSVNEIHNALMASQVHRDVILHPRFTQMGAGVLVEGGEIWLTQVFRLPEAQPASSTTSSTPAAAPAEPAESPAPPATSPELAGAGRPGGSGAGTAAAPAPGAAPAAPVRARRPASALRRVQVGGRSSAAVATPPTTAAPVETAPVTAAPVDLPVEPVVTASAPPEAVSVPLPDPADIPRAGVLAASLLLLVVAWASLATRRVVAPR